MPAHVAWAITLEVTYKKQGNMENNVIIRRWSEESYYLAKTQLDGSRNDQAEPIAKVRAVANESREEATRGKGECYRETHESRAVSGANEETTGSSILFNPRSREYSVLAPTILVYASGQRVLSSRVKGRCNNPYNKDVNHFEKIERHRINDGAPTMTGRRPLDPAKPGEFSGTETLVLEKNGGTKTVTMKWDLRCSGQ